jgi:hypothetical protein
MATKMHKITFENGISVRLTQGEVNAIEAFVRMNGTDPTKPQYEPGRIKYTTINNLVDKGVFRQGDNGIPYLVEGLLPVQGQSLYSKTPFKLIRL